MSSTLLSDRYRLEEELGQGGMGTVHRAYDTRLEREVAVKLVTAYKLEDEVPVILLIYFRGHLLLKPWVSQYPMSAMRWDHWKEVVIEPHD